MTSTKYNECMFYFLCLSVTKNQHAQLYGIDFRLISDDCKDFLFCEFYKL